MKKIKNDKTGTQVTYRAKAIKLLSCLTQLNLKFQLQIKTFLLTPGRRQSKKVTLSTNVDQNSLETEFWIAICRQSDDKWQSKTLFLAIFYPRSSIVKSVFDCRLPGVLLSNSFRCSIYYANRY